MMSILITEDGMFKVFSGEDPENLQDVTDSFESNYLVVDMGDRLVSGFHVGEAEAKPEPIPDTDTHEGGKEL